MSNKDLSHLTQAQLEDLIKRYYDNEKVDSLLKEFNIKVAQNNLVSLCRDLSIYTESDRFILFHWLFF